MTHSPPPSVVIHTVPSEVPAYNTCGSLAAMAREVMLE